MKKILLLFSMVGLLSLTGCNNDDDVVVAPVQENETFQLTVPAFAYNNNLGKFTYLYDFGNNPLYAADVVLVYRRDYDTDGQVYVWQMIPRTLYFGNDEVDYDFNFTQNDMLFLMDSNFDLTTRPDLLTNQVFRVVILPGYDNTAFKMDFSDYNTVAKTFGIKESDVKILK
jgi:hypothetical protein